jgi:hypothetical protein
MHLFGRRFEGDVFLLFQAVFVAPVGFIAKAIPIPVVVAVVVIILTN